MSYHQLILSVIFLFMCFDCKQIHAATNAILASKKSAKTVKAELLVVPDYYQATGTVKPSTESKLEAQINARITQVKAVPGSRVKKGELLLRLDDRDFQAKLEQAYQQVKAASAVYEQNQSTFRRIEKLAQSGYVSQLQFDQAKSNFLTAQAKLAQAEKLLSESKVTLSHSQIKAPFDGIILDKYVDVGDQAIPGKVLIKLQTDDMLQLWANVPEELINKLSLRQPLTVIIDALNKQKIQGQLVEIIPNIDPQTRTFLIKVAINSSTKVFPGMFGRVLIPVEQQTIVVAPNSALIYTGQLTMVLVKEPKRLKKVLVTTGRQFNGKTEILSGLNGHETLVTSIPSQSKE